MDYVLAKEKDFYMAQYKADIESSGRFSFISFLHVPPRAVCKVEEIRSGRKYALKFRGNSQKDTEEMENEWKITRLMEQELSEGKKPVDLTHVLKLVEEPRQYGKNYGLLEELATCSLADYIYMELKSRQVQLEEEVAIDWVCQIAHGAMQAHNLSQSYSHNDLKPSNVLLVGDKPPYILKVGDFALSCRTASGSPSTSAKGTYGYMAPEVFNFRQYSRRSDIFSCSIILCQLLSPDYEPPFGVGQLAQKLIEARGQALLKEFLKGTKASQRLREIILSTLKKNPDERAFNTMEEYIAALRGRTPAPVLPDSDPTLYQRLKEHFLRFKEVILDKSFHDKTPYHTASLEGIDSLFNSLQELKGLETKVMAGMKGVVISHAERMIEEARNLWEVQLKEYDDRLVRDYVKPFEKIDVHHMTELHKNTIIDLYKIAFCCGPPLSKDKEKRMGRGKERYSLKEIEDGKWIEAIPDGLKRTLGLVR